jgi:H+/Cl- antiporter ClcA
VSPALAAGVGMAAVFGAAANTPLALVVMAVEVLGAAVLPHAVLATVSAWYLTGRRGLHAGQRVAVTKDGEDATSLESQGLPPHQG